MDKIKARNVINHDYISCLALVLWLGHLRESQNLSFPTILCPRNSAQIQNFSSWQKYRGVDCSMLLIEGNSKIGIE